MRIKAAVPTVGVLFAVVGCGENSRDGRDRARALPNDPVAAIEAAGKAISEVPGYHIKGSYTDDEGKATFEGDVRADGSLRVSFDQRQGGAEVRVVDDQAYVRADREFWETNANAAAARLFADQWVTAPGEELGADSFDSFLPKTFGYCLPLEAGTLTAAGEATVDGIRARVFRSAGDTPGSSEGRVFIAAEGKPYVLRFVQEGPVRDGKTDPRCDDVSDDDSNTTKGDARLSDFDADTPIKAPEDAIDLNDAAEATRSRSAA